MSMPSSPSPKCRRRRRRWRRCCSCRSAGSWLRCVQFCMCRPARSAGTAATCASNSASPSTASALVAPAARARASVCSGEMSPFASAPVTFGILASVPARCRRRRASRCELPVFRRSTSAASTPPSSRPSRAVTVRASAASAPARTRPRAATRVRSTPRSAPPNDRPPSSTRSAFTRLRTRPMASAAPTNTTSGSIPPAASGSDPLPCPAGETTSGSPPRTAPNSFSMSATVRRGCDSASPAPPSGRASLPYVRTRGFRRRSALELTDGVTIDLYREPEPGGERLNG